MNDPTALAQETNVSNQRMQRCRRRRRTSLQNLRGDVQI
jgi:hypothetical protein